jgi:uncharacterized protein YjiS (DUF1127 family)
MSLNIHAPARPRTLPRVQIALRDMLAVWTQRRDLRALDDDALADIGLSRREAEREARRPFWDLPAQICR